VKLVRNDTHASLSSLAALPLTLFAMLDYRTRGYINDNLEPEKLVTTAS
jgi:hypothetical protein